MPKKDEEVPAEPGNGGIYSPGGAINDSPRPQPHPVHQEYDEMGNEYGEHVHNPDTDLLPDSGFLMPTFTLRMVIRTML